MRIMVSLALFGLLILSAPAVARSEESSVEVHRVPAGDGLSIALHHYRGKSRQQHSTVLILHGSSFPTMLSSGYVFADGTSFMQRLHDAGFDVWGLDFLGYGASDRYPAMDGEQRHGAPLGRAEEVVHQVEAAGRFLARSGIARFSIIAHSWGTLVAGRFAEKHPSQLDRLVLFGAVAPRNNPPNEHRAHAFTEVTAEQQLSRFSGQVPTGQPQVLEEPGLETWGPAYLATDPSASSRNPPSVRIPSGPRADLGSTWAGELLYDPSRIRSATLLIQGEWDPVSTEADIRGLFNSLSGVSIKRSVFIGRATHLLQLEKERFQLYEETIAFLRGSSEARR